MKRIFLFAAVTVLAFAFAPSAQAQSLLGKILSTPNDGPYS